MNKIKEIPKLRLRRKKLTSLPLYPSTPHLLALGSIRSSKEITI